MAGPTTLGIPYRNQPVKRVDDDRLRPIVTEFDRCLRRHEELLDSLTGSVSTITTTISTGTTPSWPRVMLLMGG